MTGIEFNGIMSSAYDLVCTSVKRPLLPAVRSRMSEIYGKSGLIDYGGGDYETRQITMHIAYIGINYIELRSRARDIAAWLSLGEWAKLIINDEPDKFYLARVIDEIDLETLTRVGEADITFECQPFAYMAVDTGADSTWADADFPWNTEIPWNMAQSYRFPASGTTNYTFDNPGIQEIGHSSPQGSKSEIVVTGTWTTISITLNGKTLTFSEAAATSKTLIIDNVEMEATLDGANKLSALSGDIDSFFSILPGNNTIRISGTGLNVMVALDFRPMWL